MAKYKTDCIFSFHNLTSIDVGSILSCTHRDGTEFFFRELTLTQENGDKVLVGLYSNTNPSLPVTLAQDLDDGK